MKWLARAVDKQVSLSPSLFDATRSMGAFITETFPTSRLRRMTGNCTEWAIKFFFLLLCVIDNLWNGTRLV